MSPVKNDLVLPANDGFTKRRRRFGRQSANTPTLSVNKPCSSCFHYWGSFEEWILSYSEMWRCKIRRVSIVTEEPATSRFRVSRHRQMDPPKHVSLSTRLHGVTCHKAATPPPLRRKKSQTARDCKSHTNGIPQNLCNFSSVLIPTWPVRKNKSVSHHMTGITQHERPWHALPCRGITAKTDDTHSRWP